MSLVLINSPAADAYQNPEYAGAMAGVVAVQDLNARQQKLNALRQQYAEQFAQINAKSGPTKAPTNAGFSNAVLMDKVDVRLGAQDAAYNKTQNSNNQVFSKILAKDNQKAAEAAAASLAATEQKSQNLGYNPYNTPKKTMS